MGPLFWAASVGLSRRLVRAVTGRGPRRYREAVNADPLSDCGEEMVELAPGHQALFDLWAGDALPLQVEKEAEARRAEKSADQVCKSFILFNISLA
jgi:hypothetical protein